MLPGSVHLRSRGRRHRDLGEAHAARRGRRAHPRDVAAHDLGIGARAAVLVAAGDHRLEHQLGAGRLAHRAVERHHLAALGDPGIEREGRGAHHGRAGVALGDPRIERADQELRPEPLDQVDDLEGGVGVLGPEAQADRGHRAGEAAERQPDRSRGGVRRPCATLPSTASVTDCSVVSPASIV